MTTTKLIVEAAFRLHKEKLLSHEELVSILEGCVNATALNNGYAEKYGLPFPTHRRRRQDRRVP
jgi:hypothetical protein